MKKKKIIKIGIDLDGVIINKPFFIPKTLIEWLYRARHNHGKKYRFPKSKIEVWLRKASHYWLLRPPMKKNLQAIREMAKKKNIQIYIISGRYNFLKEKTKQWSKKHKINGLFKNIFLNTKNQQPHLFKEKMAKKLGLGYYFDDDPITVNYLKKKIKKTKILLIRKDGELFEKLSLWGDHKQ